MFQNEVTTYIIVNYPIYLKLFTVWLLISDRTCIGKLLDKTLGIQCFYWSIL